jgi:hypothetical protein
MTSCTFSDSIAFGKTLAMERANAATSVNAGRDKDATRMQKRLIAPDLNDLYPGKFHVSSSPFTLSIRQHH